jgi:hypothetical protein
LTKNSWPGAYYFGTWDDPDGALKRYLEVAQNLAEGWPARSEKPDGLTVRDLANEFLAFKEHINAALGNADCGRLVFQALDLDAGWLDYARPKTGVPRRVPLWPETWQRCGNPSRNGSCRSRRSIRLMASFSGLSNPRFPNVFGDLSIATLFVTENPDSRFYPEVGGRVVVIADLLVSEVGGCVPSRAGAHNTIRLNTRRICRDYGERRWNLEIRTSDAVGNSAK